MSITPGHLFSFHSRAEGVVQLLAHSPCLLLLLPATACFLSAYSCLSESCPVGEALWSDRGPILQYHHREPFLVLEQRHYSS